jgi:hypothetical protein
MRRPGHTYRIHDIGRLTVALDPEARGGVYAPEVKVYWRPKQRSPRTVLRMRVLHIAFAWAFRWRRFGMLRLYVLNQRVVYGMFR